VVSKVRRVSERTAETLATDRVRSVQHSAPRRVELAAEFYDDGAIRGYERAELSFLRWAIGRGVLHPPDADPGGSRWWRAVNERLLRDKVEARLLHRGTGGAPSSPSVEYWLAFLATPAPGAWYRAHNASVVAAYLEHEDLARAELEAERFLMNVALARVLFTHAMVARPALALGALRPLGARLADPRRGSVALFLDLRRSYPEEYPLNGLTVDHLVAREARIARALDRRMIAPRLEALYRFSASSLHQPKIADFLRDGVPCYAMNGRGI
jgi:hypothetical protein